VTGAAALTVPYEPPLLCFMVVVDEHDELLIFINAHRKGSASAQISVSISPGRYFQSIVFVYPQEESVQ
jgi:hypothetical protein